MRDVEDAGVHTDGAMLLDHALVLDGHLPAGERHHARAESDVTIVKRRLQQGLRHAETILVSALRRMFGPQFDPQTAPPRRHPWMGRGGVRVVGWRFRGPTLEGTRLLPR